jgi:hypothetical protein
MIHVDADIRLNYIKLPHSANFPLTVLGGLYAHV